MHHNMNIKKNKFVWIITQLAQR